MPQQIAQSQQDIHGAEAIGHKHFVMLHPGGEAVGQQTDLAELRPRAEKIGHTLENMIVRNVKQ